ncbi:hypothetical protein C8R47DRAFT_302656 [Mycena vitilis]|nr:hypothetical protein C8R47DRAFT_302656 [Mycena vitilis]
MITPLCVNQFSLLLIQYTCSSALFVHRTSSPKPYFARPCGARRASAFNLRSSSMLSSDTARLGVQSYLENAPFFPRWLARCPNSGDHLSACRCSTLISPRLGTQNTGTPLSVVQAVSWGAAAI